VNLEIAALLGLPLLGGLILAFAGARRNAAVINIGLSLLTFAAAIAIAADVLANGNRTALAEQFFLDSFNVFLVALTAFVGLTTAIYSRTYMRIEVERGKLTEARLRLYHSMYQLFMFTMLLALTTNNMGLLWVAM
jgi:hydrogenase-4 component F